MQKEKRLEETKRIYMNIINLVQMMEWSEIYKVKL